MDEIQRTTNAMLALHLMAIVQAIETDPKMKAKYREIIKLVEPGYQLKDIALANGRKSV